MYRQAELVIMTFQQSYTCQNRLSSIFIGVDGTFEGTGCWLSAYRVYFGIETKFVVYVLYLQLSRSRIALHTVSDALDPSVCGVNTRPTIRLYRLGRIELD